MATEITPVVLNPNGSPVRMSVAEAIRLIDIRDGIGGIGATWYSLADRAARNAKIRAELEAGLPIPEIAERHGITARRIRELRRGWGFPRLCVAWEDAEIAAVAPATSPSEAVEMYRAVFPDAARTTKAIHAVYFGLRRAALRAEAP